MSSYMKPEDLVKFVGTVLPAMEQTVTTLQSMFFVMKDAYEKIFSHAAPDTTGVTDVDMTWIDLVSSCGDMATSPAFIPGEHPFPMEECSTSTVVAPRKRSNDSSLFGSGAEEPAIKKKRRSTVNVDGSMATSTPKKKGTKRLGASGYLEDRSFGTKRKKLDNHQTYPISSGRSNKENEMDISNDASTVMITRSKSSTRGQAGSERLKWNWLPAASLSRFDLPTGSVIKFKVIGAGEPVRVTGKVLSNEKHYIELMACSSDQERMMMYRKRLMRDVEIASSAIASGGYTPSKSPNMFSFDYSD